MIKLVFDSVPDSLPDAHRALRQQEKSDRKKTGRQMTRPKRTGGYLNAAVSGQDHSFQFVPAGQKSD